MYCGDVVRLSVPPNARVLDCACGTGQLAVGLAERAALTWSPRTPAMGSVRPDRAGRQRAGCLASSAPGELGRAARPPGGLPRSTWCSASATSLGHAEGAAGRRTALEAMSRLLSPGGRLVLTSRNWELVRSAGSRVDRSAIDSSSAARRPRCGRRATTEQIEQRPGSRSASCEIVWSPRSSRMGRCEPGLGADLSVWPYRYEDLVAQVHGQRRARGAGHHLRPPAAMDSRGGRPAASGRREARPSRRADPPFLRPPSDRSACAAGRSSWSRQVD